MKIRHASFLVAAIGLVLWTAVPTRGGDTTPSEPSKDPATASASGKNAAASLPKASPPKAALKSLDVYPDQIILDGPRARQRLVVVGRFADGRAWDLTRQVQWTSSSPQCVRVEKGFAIPVSDGKAQLVASVGGRQATVPVTVRDAQADRPVGFATEVIPVLNKYGCNQGACHGAQHGRGGFKLSLFGFDPIADHFQIVQSAEGRRVVLSDPERSTILLKATLTMEHGGGERFPVGSQPYRLLQQWLEDGAPAPSRNDPTVAKVEVLPSRRLMQPGEQQQLAVRATWSDGRQEDITLTAQYDSLNDALARVDEHGLVQALDRGETYIMIRYCGQVGVFQVTVPYATTASTEPKGWKDHNYIDKHLRAKWRSLGLGPSPLCTDAEFLRRIYLDTIGTLPTPEEIRAFLADSDPDKRAKAIDRVLDRPEYVDYWTLKWGDLLRINRDALQDKGMWSFRNWVRAAIRDNRPMDQFARDIITAEGSTYLEGPANYYRIGRNASDWAETTSQVFLGVRIQCAKCHHHPFEKWSQDDYYGMAAFFVRMRTKSSQEFGLFGRETVVYLRPNGEQRHPRKGVIVPPRPLDGEVMDDPFDRRRRLADWLTNEGKLLFARNIVNRYWGYCMGRGLVEPLDDMRATNPPSNPELLDELAHDFIQSGYDVKHLLRTIMNSRGYQLSSRLSPANEADKENVYYGRYTVKRLTAEQLADAIDFATGTQVKYRGLPLGTRAIQLPDSKVQSYLLDVFGRPPRQVTCECERSIKPNIAQALHLVNGDLINNKIRDSKGRVARLFKEKKPLPQIVDELYLVTLSRPPVPPEREAALAWIAKAPQPRIGAEDLLWTLLNSKEFLFNH